MAENKTNRKKKINTSSHLTAVVFWICLILIVLPVGVLGWILISSSMDTGTPIFGNRFEGDLDPAITENDMNQVGDAVKGIESVDDSFVTMTSATLRVYADVADDASEETCNSVADQIYAKVAEILDPSVYFTRNGDMKMYDMEIHVYTLPERTEAEGENFVYVIDTKTSNMAEPAKQTVSKAKDQAVADQLRQDVIDRLAAEEEAANQEAEGEGAGEDTPEGGEGE
ncbi:MAG: hypothetical protein ACI32N_00095 [Bulleidia sp.]